MRNRARLTTESLESRFTPATITITALTGGFTASNNNYRILADAFTNPLSPNFVKSGDTVILSGVFDWTETFAAASWAQGNDGVAGTGGDDYAITIGGGLKNVTVTAASLGSAVIQGPGDLPNVDLEGVFYFPGAATPAEANTGWTFSNLTLLDFDLGIGMYADPKTVGAGAYSGTTITNNRIRIATDLSTAAAPADVSQNVGINYSFGTGQTISNNLIEIPGDAAGSTANSSTVGIQSDTYLPGTYEGLRITGNTIRVLNAAAVANPQRIVGIWENGHSHGSNITVSGNQFLNAAGVNPAANLQQAFIITSHSGPNGVVTYAGNTVTGANIGLEWLSPVEFPGYDFSSYGPVLVLGNTLTNVQTGILIQSKGVAELRGGNVITGTATGTGVSIQAGSVATIYNGSFTGTGVGIDVNGGTALIQGTDLNNNAIAGLRVENGGLADAGGGGTSLGTSSGGNNFANYRPAGAARAIINLNAAGAAANTSARNNVFASTSLAFIEQVVDHSVDVPGRGTVDFSSPAAAGNVAPSVVNQSFELPAGSPSGALAGVVAASDANNNPLTYSIIGGNTGGAFAINPTTGRITVANPGAVSVVGSGPFNLIVQVSDGLAFSSATVTVTLFTDQQINTPAATPVYLTAVGADAGANGHVKVYNQDGSLRFSFFAFDGFNGGVRVATGDVNGDQVEDIVVGAGAGAGAAGGHVKVFDGATGALISSFFSFTGFNGGVNVAVGDVDGDGRGDIIVGTGSGAAHVKAFSFANNTLLSSFIAFSGFNGGVTVAAGNYDGTGADEIVVGTATGASHVKAFGRTGNEVLSFLAFPGFSGGVTVAAGDLNADGFAELVVGTGPGVNGQVKVFQRTTVATGGATIATISGTSGARVGLGRINGDAVPDILVGPGPGSNALVRTFDGSSFAALGTIAAFDGFLGGVFVG
ncbi:cadherin domain-containing protein [Gemmata sp. JC673]|uniref:Cadherin domain-containing protein n=1 Tax=Gemmata algarum TaxID=2975278 RepID=A0ABU5EW20_9BACT|nr:cadherin domain-containing protein [Gemmata algarum]MDY3559503.1 cadherin domain-containing protein [Gemmata algarum]